MDIFNIYINTLRNNYFNSEGRANRKEYWLFTLANSIIGFVIGYVGCLIGAPVIGTIYGLAVLIPGVCIGIRRLHDVGRSGWWFLLAFTGIGAIVLFVFYCLDSEPGENAYGPNPKGVEKDNKTGDDNINDFISNHPEIIKGDPEDWVEE